MSIVVGVDGAEGSVHALRFALEEAKARNTDVKAVGVWHVPASVYAAGWAPVPVDPGEWERLAEAALDRALVSAAAGNGSGVAVTAVVCEGQPADALVAEARGAELLVVGSRGLGGFRGLLLGSVSRQCAHHAPCPVAIVPAAAG
jgi:nucleotide-binding universal stress UspA family protein